MISQPRRVRLVEQAKRRSISLRPMGPGLEHYMISNDGDLAKIAPAEYPCRLSIAVDSENGVYQVIVNQSISAEPYQRLSAERAGIFKAPRVKYKDVETELPAMNRNASRPTP